MTHNTQHKNDENMAVLSTWFLVPVALKYQTQLKANIGEP